MIPNRRFPPFLARLSAAFCVLPFVLTEAQDAPKLEREAEREPSVAERRLEQLHADSRIVLNAITTAAQENRKRPRRRPRAAGKPGDRKSGDALTAYYVSRAAAAAAEIPADRAVPAFLIATGYALGDAGTLLRNPFTRTWFDGLDSPQARKTRAAVLGKATMRGRRDLAQHFFVSCALAEAVGTAAAESAGLLKEQMDMIKGSGFSFRDLNADLSGVGFAGRLKDGEIKLDTVQTHFSVDGVLPADKNLREGFGREAFAREFGSMDDERYRGVVKTIRADIETLQADFGRIKGL